MGVSNRLSDRIRASMGEKQAELVLKHARVINVFTGEIESLDIAVTDGYIVGLGEYEGIHNVDLTGCIVCPGLIDGHIHLESAMVTPWEFQQAVLPHGTTAVITDPHEIANVAGTAGIDYMIEATKNLDLDVFFMLPSCVPATGLDESGAILKAADLKSYYKNDRVLGLAELMDSYHTILADGDILDKIRDAKEVGACIDGHAPALTGRKLNAYIMAGVQSDHECADPKEAIEKLRRGQWIMIRQGTAAKNLDALLPLFEEPYYHRCMLVTDDKHPGDLLLDGHIDAIIRQAVSKGADVIHGIQMATLHAAAYFGLKDRGAVAPGYQADLIVLSDLEHMKVKQVYKAGKLVAENGICINRNRGGEETVYEKKIMEKVMDSFHLKEITCEDFQIKEEGNCQRVLCLMENELITTEQIVELRTTESFPRGVDISRDIIKMAVLERHLNTGHIGVGFLHGYGLKRGAVASSVAHDSHNLAIVGTNDCDMALAGNRVCKNKGGLAVAVDGIVIGELPLPIAGLMSELSAEEVEMRLEALKKELRNLGVPETIDPFMTLAFASLPVIPKLRINTHGLIDVEKQKTVPAVFLG